MPSIRPYPLLCRSLALVSLTLGCPLAAFSQAVPGRAAEVKNPPPAAPAAAATLYAGEATYFERIDRVYTYAADGTGSREISGVLRVQSESGVKELSILNLPFASASEHMELDYVRVRRASGETVETPAADVQEQPAPVTREAPFYSDLKFAQIPVRSLRVGDTLEYHVRFVRTKAEAPGQFWQSENLIRPSSGAVALAETLTLHAPETKYVQVWSPGLAPQVSSANGVKTWVWHSAQLLPVAGKSAKELLEADHLPDLATRSGPRLPAIAWTTFHSWAEVGDWYRQLESPRLQPDDDVRARVQTLTAGATTPQQKARAIYGFVGPQVRYIGVAFGIGRYQPHDAGDVLRNQYGDCKDKHTLLAAMLAAAGIPADAALIGAGEAIQPDVPSPGWFNHVITLAHIDGRDTWLDATAEVAPFELLVSQLRGQQALVIPATGDAHLMTTPKNTPFPEVNTFTAEGALDTTGTSESKITLELHGDAEVLFREAARSVSPAQWDELTQKISESMGYSGKVSNAEFSRPEDLATPFRVSYTYKREKNGDWDNLRILAQVPPAAIGDVDEKDPPVTPIELGTPHVELAHAVMKLPDGWSAELPLPIHAKSAFATLDKTYRLDHGAIITDRRVEILVDHVPATDWKVYHQWHTDAGLDGEPYIQLTRVAGAHAAVNDPAAGKLVDEAARLVSQKDLEGARKKLDQARALNERQTLLWANYAMIDLAYGAPTKATEELNKEIEYHPDEGGAYRMLAAAQMQRNDTDGAIGTMTRYMARNPGDETGALTLGSLYRTKRRTSEAIPMMRKALAANPQSVPLQLELATELIDGDGAAEAQPLLESIVRESNDPLQLNNAAYELANHSVGLPVAEVAARKAVDQLDEATSDGETGQTALARTVLLINTWDTYGWILYREGKYEDAVAWLQAAWRNGLAQEPGFHLAQALEKAGRPGEALAVYQLAAQARSEGGEDLAGRIAERLAALKKQGVQPKASGNARGDESTLQAQRKYVVPRAAGTPEFWSEVQLDVTAAGVASVQSASETTPAAETSKAASVSSAQTQEMSLPESMRAGIQAVPFDLGIPSSSKAHITRRGVLSCRAATTCDLVLTPVN